MRQSEIRAGRQQSVIKRLALEKPFKGVDPKHYLENVCELLSEGIAAARASVWLLSDDGSELQCIELYEAGEKTHSRGAVLKARDFPEYFHTIKSEVRINAEDAQNDPRTQNMTDNYLGPLGITSLLDGGIVKNGILAGVVCVEHIGGKRKWYPDEETFVTIVASFVGQSLTEFDIGRVEEELKESRQLLDSIIRNIPDIIYRLDSQGRITFISESVRTYGYVPSEMIGTSMLDYVYPEDKEKAINKINERRTGDRKTASFEIRLMPRSLGERHFEVRSGVMGVIPVFLLDAEGLYRSGEHRGENFIGTQGVARDITDRKRAEDDLRDRERKARSVFDSSFGLIGLLTPRGVVVEVNRTALDLVGVRLSDVTGAFFWETPWWSHDPEMQTRIKSAVAAASAGELVRSDATHPAKDGTLHTVDFTVKPITDEKGRVTWLIAEGRDITEQKRTDKALRESEALLKSAGRIAKVGAWTADLISETITWSDEVALIHGMSPGYSPAGDESFRFVAPEWVEKVADAYRTCIETGEPLEEEFELITASGNRIWVRGNAELVRDQTGKPARIIGALQDITTSKRAEEEREKLRAQFMQAHKMEALGTLAGGIAHDFNNILTSVFGFTELARIKLSKGGDIDRELSQIMNAGLRARDLAGQILTFSRRTDVEISPIDIRPLIKETLKFLKASTPSTIEIKSRLGSSDATVMADPTQIHQILMNLCTNAAHAMREKGGVLDVDLREVDLGEDRPGEYEDLKPGKHIQLAIADTGKGIPSEFMDRVFEPFFTTKRRGEGTGLGLSVVHGIIKGMGGAITVSSEEGVGTVFQILIPRNQAGETRCADPAIQPQRGDERILFVDDEETILLSMRNILESLGYRVVARTNPAEALALFKAEPSVFDVVLTDMTMPEMSGIELSKRLLKIRGDIPIVLCTGFGPGASKELMATVGIREVVLKPMKIIELVRAIRKALES